MIWIPQRNPKKPMAIHKPPCSICTAAVFACIAATATESILTANSPVGEFAEKTHTHMGNQAANSYANRKGPNSDNSVTFQGDVIKNLYQSFYKCRRNHKHFPVLFWEPWLNGERTTASEEILTAYAPVNHFCD